jgi:hypothetical protein
VTVRAPSLSILLVTQFAPPAGFSAARRTAGLTKYLARLGHRVTVLTSLASGRGPIEGAARVIRTRDVVASRVNWRRGHFEAVKGGRRSGYQDEPSRLASVVVPDLSLVGWLPFAARRALALAGREPLDCLVTSSPPESIHLLGLALRRQGLPWVADLQDGWTFETTHPDWPLELQRRVDRALEELVAKRADLVTTVTEPITLELAARVSTPVMTLTNGFDPDERVQAGKEEAGLDPDRFSLVYTGRLALARSTPRPFLDGLRMLRRRAPKTAARLEVVFAGPLSDGERALLAAPDLEGMVRWVGNLERGDALALQAAADALLLIVPPGRLRSVATAKLYEYLTTAHPIFVLGEENAAAAIVREARAGLVTAADDRERIAADLERLLSGGASGDGAANGVVDRYSYPNLAATLAERVAELAASA